MPNVVQPSKTWDFHKQNININHHITSHAKCSSTIQNLSFKNKTNYNTTVLHMPNVVQPSKTWVLKTKHYRLQHYFTCQM